MRVVFVTVGSWAGLLAVGAVLEALGLLYPPLRSLAALWALAVMLLGPFLLVPLLTPALVVGGTRMYLSLAVTGRVPSRATDEQIAALVPNNQR